MADERSKRAGAWKAWAGFFAWTVFLLGAAFYSGTGDAWRRAGGILTLSGLIAVGSGLWWVQAEFGGCNTFPNRVQRLLRRGRRWVLTKVGLGPEPQTVELATGRGSLSGAGDLRASLSVGPREDLESRVEFLERSMKEVRDRIAAVEEASKNRDVQLEDSIRREREDRVADVRRLEERDRTLAVGGLRLELVGLIWLMLGTVASTWSGSLPGS